MAGTPSPISWLYCKYIVYWKIYSRWRAPAQSVTHGLSKLATSERSILNLPEANMAGTLVAPRGSHPGHHRELSSAQGKAGRTLKVRLRLDVREGAPRKWQEGRGLAVRAVRRTWRAEEASLWEWHAGSIALQMCWCHPRSHGCGAVGVLSLYQSASRSEASACRRRQSVKPGYSFGVYSLALSFRR